MRDAEMFCMKITYSYVGVNKQAERRNEVNARCIGQKREEKENVCRQLQGQCTLFTALGVNVLAGHWQKGKAGHSDLEYFNNGYKEII